MAKSLFQELKRRNVFKVAAAYLIVSWLILQVISSISPLLDLPDMFGKMVLVLLLVGFPIAIIFAWAFELTPDGVKKESEVNPEDSITQTTRQRINYIIIGALVLIIGGLVFDKLSPDIAETANTKTLQISRTDTNKTSPSLISKSSKNPSASVDTSLALGVAVLPFENRSPDKNDAFFAAGIHDDLLTHLANIKAFKVISRTSVMEYKKTTKNIKQIGKELGVNNILEGAVQRSGNRVRINVQLIDATTDKHLWAKIYDRKLTTDNLFDIQSEISQAIAVALKTTLAPEQFEKLSKPPTQNLKAYDLYLQARQFIYKNTASSFQTGIRLLHEAIKLDPKFKQAWISLANAQIGFYWNSQGSTAIRDEALQSLKQAEILDPDSPDLAKVYGFYYYWGFLDYAKALTYLDQALDKKTNDAEAYAVKGWILRRSGRWQESIAPVKNSLILNPRAIVNWSEIANTYTYLYRFAEASAAIAKAHSINSTNPWPIFYHANLVLNQKGDIKLAQSITTEFQFSHEREMIRQYVLIQLLNKNYQKALNKVDEITDAEEIWRQSIFLRDDFRAQIYFFQGELDKAKRAALTTLRRLDEKSKILGDDYRLYRPRARMAAILSQSDKVRQLIKLSMQTSPTDAITQTDDRYEYSRIFAMAGLLDETVNTLEPQLSPPSFTSTNYVNIDPAFDQLRDKPEFKAMLARHPQVIGSTEKEVTP